MSKRKSLVADGAGDAADVQRILLDYRQAPSRRELVRRSEAAGACPDYDGSVGGVHGRRRRVGLRSPPIVLSHHR